MNRLAAKQRDRVTAIDMHLIQPPNAPQLLVPHPFSGVLDGGLSQDVRINGRPAATELSTATNTPGHLPQSPGDFVRPPSNQAQIRTGSTSVRINHRGAARAGDPAFTCNDPMDLAIGTVVVPDGPDGPDGPDRPVRIGG